MRTVFPEKPAGDFNEWIGYIKSEIDKSNKVEVKVKEEKRDEEVKYYTSKFGDLRSGSSTGTPITG
jgi:hypothetical protein